MSKISTHGAVDQTPAKVDTATALEVIERDKARQDYYGAYIGLDVHKDSIAVALAHPGRGEAQSWGEIANKPKSVRRLVERLSRLFEGQVL
ncbi:MAG TPA: IS110 family transposase, partial [Gammaproteobacteria bacterium]|nr:IS110 family transposase [Gammaproteobacteria bacterium]